MAAFPRSPRTIGPPPSASPGRDEPRLPSTKHEVLSDLGSPAAPLPAFPVLKGLCCSQTRLWQPAPPSPCHYPDSRRCFRKTRLPGPAEKHREFAKAGSGDHTLPGGTGERQGGKRRNSPAEARPCRASPSQPTATGSRLSLVPPRRLGEQGAHLGDPRQPQGQANRSGPLRVTCEPAPRPH